MERTHLNILNAPSTAGRAVTVTADIGIQSSARNDLIDITELVAALVAEADIETGIALVSCPHTTCAIVVNEDDPGFKRDLTRALEQVAPLDGPYEHDVTGHTEEGEPANGYAHVRGALLSSTSVTLPIREGALALGRWQRIFFLELDRGRPRSCQVTLLGRSAP